MAMSLLSGGAAEHTTTLPKHQSSESGEEPGEMTEGGSSSLNVPTAAPPPARGAAYASAATLSIRDNMYNM